MIREAIARVSSGSDLTAVEAEGVMEEIMRGAATPAQIGGILTALRMKGEAVAEIAAFAGSYKHLTLPTNREVGISGGGGCLKKKKREENTQGEERSEKKRIKYV